MTLTKKGLGAGIVSGLVTASLLFAGCSNGSGDSSGAPSASSAPSASNSPQASAQPSQGQNTAKASDKLITVKGWAAFTPPTGSEGVSTYNDHLVWKELPKITNVKVDWTATTDDYKTQLGLITASGNLPDLIGRIDPQLAAQYGSQGALMPLESLIKQHAPNLQKILNDNPQIKAQLTTPEGHIYFFPRLLFDPRTQAFNGFFIRKDWLDRLGLKSPDTTDDLYNVLKTFKEKDANGNGQKDEVPMAGDPRPLIWAFGVGSRGNGSANDFFVEGGKIKYGPTDPRFKDALAYINKLYTEGLLDNEYLGQTSDNYTARFTNELSGFTYGSHAGVLTRYNSLLEGAGKKPGLAGVIPPKGPTGERNILGKHTEIDPGVGVSIASTSKYGAELVKMMDYFYTKEGSLLLYFGKEGVTYTMKDGVPAYTDKVAKDPKLSVLNYMNAYVGQVSTWASSVIPEHYLATISDAGKQSNAVTVANVGNKKPPLLNFTQAELKEVQGLQRDIDTFVDENVQAFIRGKQPIGDYDKFVAGLQKIGSDKLQKLYETAYERFLSVKGGK